MRIYLLRRLLLLIPILWGVSTAVFFLQHAIPGDPVDFILGEQSLALERDQLRADLGLDQPVLQQYQNFLVGLVKGNWGKSIYDRRPVLQHLREKYRATAELAIASILFALVLSLPIGIIAALKKYSAYDHGLMLFSLIGISMPNFWLGPILILFFSVQLFWLPVSGRDSFISIILPAVTLGTAMSALLSRMTRSSMLEVMQQEYVTTARAKGLSETKVIWKHALRNALNPIITIIGLQLGTLLAGAIVTEKIFSWPGLGSLLIDSINRRDYPVVQGCILLIAFIYVAVNTLTDLVYRFVDPRVRLS